jgi:hypothetical protein
LPETQSRAGTYQRQPTGYRAFIPVALPPQPEVKLGGELQRLLSQADLALGRLDGSIQTLPNPDLFVVMYVRKEAVLSSQIEGTQSSLQDLLAARGPALFSRHSKGCRRSSELRRRHELRSRAAIPAACLGAAHSGDSRKASPRRARLWPCSR